MTRAAFGILVALFLYGCAAPLPKYPPMDPAEALRVMQERDSQVRSLQSECDLSLRDAAGSSVSFDAAIVAEWPSRLRLRAWKFGHAAFDLTYTPDGLWMYMPEEARRRAGDHAKFDVTAGQFGRVWQMLGPASVEGSVVTSDQHSFTVRRSLDPAAPSQGVFECDVDRDTLTVREYRFVDADSHVRQTLKPGSYRVHTLGERQVVWPARIAADGESGRITIRLIDPEFNAELPETAFTPPTRATKQP